MITMQYQKKFTNPLLERYNRTLKYNCLTKSSDHLVEAIRQLVKHSINLQREYIKRQTKQSMRYMKPNPDDTLFIQKYHKVLTDNAIRLAREANNLAIKCHDTWELE